MIGWPFKKRFSLRNQEEALRRQQHEKIRVQKLMLIGEQCAAHICQSTPATEHGEMLYNEIGYLLNK